MRELLLHKGDCSFCTKLVRRDLFADMEFPVGVLNEDFHLLVQMLPKISGMMSLKGQTYHVFYRIGSNTRKKGTNDFSRVFADNVDNADMVQRIVDSTYPSLHDIAVRFGLFQRLDYLLHIPIPQMKKDNVQYSDICKFVRKHVADTMKNTYLTKKNKIYLLLFAIAPKGVRKVHAWTMNVRQRKDAT